MECSWNVPKCIVAHFQDQDLLSRLKFITHLHISIYPGLFGVCNTFPWYRKLKCRIVFSHILVQKLLHDKARPQEHLTGLSHLLALSGYCLTFGYVFQEFSCNPSMNQWFDWCSQWAQTHPSRSPQWVNATSDMQRCFSQLCGSHHCNQEQG